MAPNLFKGLTKSSQSTQIGFAWPAKHQFLLLTNVAKINLQIIKRTFNLQQTFGAYYFGEFQLKK